MPVKSSFLPKEGLQGESIPSHITWENLDYDTLLLNYPSFLFINEIYNASNLRDFDTNHALEISNEDVDVDGYLGLLFKSTRSQDDEKVTGSVSFSFLKNKEVVHFTNKEISLYRPLIKLIDTPLSINVTFPEKKVENKIKLKNVGDATSVIGIITAEYSDVKETLSDDQKKFLDEFNSSLQDEVQFLIDTYPKYESFLNTFLEHEINDSNVETRKINEELEYILQNDILFANSFFDSIQRVFMSNMKFKTLVDNFIAYTESLASSKILILNPFAIIEISKKPQKVHLKLIQSDLLLNEYEPIFLSPIEISANEKGNIELHKLFNWGENGSFNQ
nr:hypothetical protein [uncultured Methanolobus sp.]